MPPKKDSQTIRILIAERDPKQGETMAKLLRTVGHFEVDHVTSMKETIRKLKSTTFSLVITNTAVDKEKDGIRLAQMILLRRMVAGPPPVMIVSPLRDGKIIRDGMRLGVVDYIIYPYKPEDLVRRVQRVLGEWDAMPDAELDDAVRQTLATIIDLPTISPVCARLEQLLANSNVSPDDVALAIQLDPSISAKILKLANSAEYGLQRRIASVKEAVTMIGLRKVSALVQAASTFDAIGRIPETPHFDRLEFWKHSIGVGAIASVLAPRCGLDADQALVAGVLHDVGKVIMDGFFPDFFREALEKAASDGIALVQAEDAVLPVTHESVGAHLAGEWGLPARLVDAIGAHHSLAPRRDDHLRLVQLTHVANSICRQLGVGNPGDDDQSPPSPDVVAGLGLTPAVLEELTPAFHEAIRRTQALLELV